MLYILMLMNKLQLHATRDRGFAKIILHERRQTLGFMPYDSSYINFKNREKWFVVLKLGE